MYANHSNFILFLLSIAFLTIGWYGLMLPLVLLIAFVPLLLLATKYKNREMSLAKYWLLVYGTMLVWNFVITYWICNFFFLAGIAAFLLNAFLMSVPFIFFAVLYAKTTSICYSLFCFVLYWLSFEFIHLKWEFSWPWLTLGNAFARTTSLIQWYEYTGVLGGSLWLLVGNIIFFLMYIKVIRAKVQIIFCSALLVAPIIISFLIERNKGYQIGSKTEVLIVQPNIDPALEKFSYCPNFISYDKQIDIFIELITRSITPNTKLIILPETAFSMTAFSEELPEFIYFKKFRELLTKFPEAKILAGIDLFHVYGNRRLSNTARFDTKLGYYDLTNSAILLDSSNITYLYHKSKLIPGLEKVPYDQFIRPLRHISYLIKGSGSLKSQKNISLFNINNQTDIAPTICYEAIYGAYISKFVASGADIICNISNDGMWKNTTGYEQHYLYSKLRAIENRKYLVRCANTGISAIIDPSGTEIHQIPFGKRASFAGNVFAVKGTTFYTVHKDFIGSISLILSGINLILSFCLKFNIINL